MTDPSLSLQSAIVLALKGNSGVSALVSNRVYDTAPSSATFPNVTLGESQVLPDKADCIDGVEVFHVIHAWSRSPGFAEVKRIGAAIIAALDDQALNVSGSELVVFELESANYLRDPDGITAHVAITFHALLQAAS